MNRTKFIVTFLALAIFASAAAPATAYENVAMLTFFVGDVQIRLNDESDWGEPIQDITLQEADSIKTGPDGKARIVFSNGSAVTIGPLSILDIASVMRNEAGGKSVDLDLSAGVARARVDKLSSDSSFQITTPTAIAAVRGTDFIVEFRPELSNTEVTVVDGAVEVASRLGTIKEKVQLLKDQTTDVGDRKPPSKPRKADPGKLKQMKQELVHRLDGKEDAEIAATPPAPDEKRQLTDQQAAALVTLKASDIPDDQKREVAQQIVNGEVSPEKTRTILNLKEAGATKQEVATVLNTIQQKDIPEQDIEQFARTVNTETDSSVIREKVTQFIKNSGDYPDRPDRPNADGEKPELPVVQPTDSAQPSVQQPQIGETTRPGTGELDDRKQQMQNDVKNNTDEQRPNDPRQLEMAIIQKAKEIGMPQDKIDGMIQAAKDGKMELREIQMIIRAIERGMEPRYVEDVFRKMLELRIDPQTRFMVGRALEFGIPRDSLETLIKGIVDKKITIEQAKERLKEFIESKVNAADIPTPAIIVQPPADGSVTTPDTSTPSQSDTETTERIKSR